MAGSIKLFRQFRDWEWYQDENVKSVFIELLLTANYKDLRWQGKVVKRGQLITSRAKLAAYLGKTEQNIRTALGKLQSTGEIELKATNKYTLITICKYDYWQSQNGYEQPTTNQPTNQQVTNEQPTTNQPTNQQVTNEQPTTNQQLTTSKEREEYKEREEIKNNISTTTTTISRESNEKWMAELERTETESFSTICLGLKINNETYFEFLEGFKRECKMQDTIHLSWSDTRKHFIAWCRCEMDRRSKQNKNGNNNANSQSNSRRYWYEPTGEEDYSGDSL